MLVPCMEGEVPALCMFGGHWKAGRGYVLACCLRPCWKAGVVNPLCASSLWQCLCGSLLINTGDLGQKGGLSILQLLITLSSGKATSERVRLLPRRGGRPLVGHKGPFVAGNRCTWTH